MCTECGCGLPGDKPFRILGHEHEHEHEHHHPHQAGNGEDRLTDDRELSGSRRAFRRDAKKNPRDAGATGSEEGRGGSHCGHDHDHHQHEEHGHHHHHHYDHEHGHTHTHEHPALSDEPRRHLDIHRSILDKNDRQAERNRGFFQARGLLVINVLSSPGSGKTSLIRETIRALANRLKTAVIVGDLETDNDARRLRETSAEVVQVTTGTVCHLEAEMVARAVKQLHLDGVQLLIIENVGNLVCPASYDLGEDLRVVLLSVTEGEDKPLKYPPMFQSAGAMIVSKIDLAEVCEYDRIEARANLERLAPAAPIFEVSAKTGQGMEEWCGFLVAEWKKVRASLIA